MEAFGRTLLAVAVALVGGIALLLSRLGASRLPGDIVIGGRT